MIQHHKWSLTELDNMLPFERAIYSEMVSQWVKEENERIAKEQKGYNQKF